MSSGRAKLSVRARLIVVCVQLHGTFRSRWCSIVRRDVVNTPFYFRSYLDSSLNG